VKNPFFCAGCRNFDHLRLRLPAKAGRMQTINFCILAKAPVTLVRSVPYLAGALRFKKASRSSWVIACQ
jgi:hypothetical protein